MATAGFFAIDYRSVCAACRRLSPNAAAAFVALARFTRADQLSTTAGATSISERLALSRGRAEAALVELEREGFVSPAGTAFRRKLRAWYEVQLGTAVPSDRQSEVMARIRTGPPILSAKDPDYQVAKRLEGLSAVERRASKKGGLFSLPASDLVWLPNTFVDGFDKPHDGPLKRLRQMQDNRCLALTLTSYRETNLAENGGLHWMTVRRTYKREALCKIGSYTVWGFQSENSATSPWGSPLARSHHKRAINRDELSLLGPVGRGSIGRRLRLHPASR